MLFFGPTSMKGISSASTSMGSASSAGPGKEHGDSLSLGTTASRRSAFHVRPIGASSPFRWLTEPCPRERASLPLPRARLRNNSSCVLGRQNQPAGSIFSLQRCRLDRFLGFVSIYGRLLFSQAQRDERFQHRLDIDLSGARLRGQ